MAYVPLAQFQQKFLGKSAGSLSSGSGYVPLSQFQTKFVSTNTGQSTKPKTVSTPSKPVSQQPSIFKTVGSEAQSFLDTSTSVAKNIIDDVKGIFTGKNGQSLPITLPKQNPSVSLTPEQKQKIGSLKTGQIIPDFKSTQAGQSAKLKGNLIDNVFYNPDTHLKKPGETTLSAAKPKTIMDKAGEFVTSVLNFLSPPEAQNNQVSNVARSQNAYQILKNHPELNKKTNVVALSQPGGSPFKNSQMEQISKDLGIKSTLSNSEFTNLMMALSLPVSLGAGAAKVALAEGAPVITATKQLVELGKFTAVSTLFDKAFQKISGKQSVSELLPENTPQALKITVDALEFLGKIYATHGVNKVGSDVVDVLTKSTMEKYNLPQELTITGSQLRDIHQTGKLTTAEEKDMVSKLFSGNPKEYTDAIKSGKDIAIKVPASKIVTVADRPYWAKIKGLFGIDPSEVKRTVTGATNLSQTTPIAGLLNEGTVEFTPDQAKAVVVGSDLEKTPFGKEILKTAIQAEQAGQNIKMDLQKGGQGELKTPGGITAKNIELVDPVHPINGSVANAGLEDTSQVSKFLPKARNQEEQATFDYVINNLDQAKKDYTARVTQEYGYPNVISADEGKYVIPGYTGVKAPIYHEAASALAKSMYEDLLSANKGEGNNTVLFTSGGTGVGKTTALRSAGVDFNDYPIIYDTNSGEFESSSKKIDMALKNGYKVEIVYTQRDPIVAFTEGVIPRVRTKNRIVNIDEHLNRHIGSFNTLQHLQDKYGDKIKIEYVDNTGGHGEAKKVSFDKLHKFNYTDSALRSKLYEELQKAHETGKLTTEEANAISGEKDYRTENGRSPQQESTQEVNPQTRSFDSTGKEITDKNVKVLTGREVEAIREVIQVKLQHVRETSSDPESFKKGLEDVFKYVESKAGDDKQVLSAFRTELNQEMYGMAGGGKYTDQYRALQGLKQDPEIGPIIDTFENKIMDLDERLLTSAVKPQKYKVPDFIQKKIPKAGATSGEGTPGPVGTGTPKESRAFKRFVEQLKDSDPKRYEELSGDKVTYNILNLEKDAENALQLIEQDPQRAYRIAKGLETPPEGQTETAISIGLANRAEIEKNFEMVKDLESSRSLRQTRRGQEIVSERGRFDENSPHRFIQEVLNKRLEKLGKGITGELKIGAGKIKSVKEAAVRKIDRQVEILSDKIKKEQKKAALAMDIQKFIDDLICK